MSGKDYSRSANPFRGKTESYSGDGTVILQILTMSVERQKKKTEQIAPCHMGQINSLLAMVAQLAAGRGLSKHTKAKATKEIASRGLALPMGEVLRENRRVV